MNIVYNSIGGDFLETEIIPFEISQGGEFGNLGSFFEEIGIGTRGFPVVDTGVSMRDTESGFVWEISVDVEIGSGVDEFNEPWCPYFVPHFFIPPCCYL